MKGSVHISENMFSCIQIYSKYNLGGGGAIHFTNITLIGTPDQLLSSLSLLIYCWSIFITRQETGKMWWDTLNYIHLVGPTVGWYSLTLWTDYSLCLHTNPWSVTWLPTLVTHLGCLTAQSWIIAWGGGGGWGSSIRFSPGTVHFIDKYWFLMTKGEGKIKLFFFFF